MPFVFQLDDYDSEQMAGQLQSAECDLMKARAYIKGDRGADATPLLRQTLQVSRSLALDVSTTTRCFASSPAPFAAFACFFPVGFEF